MRAPTALVTALVATAALGTAWQFGGGNRPSSGTLPGIRVLAPAPARPTTAGARSTVRAKQSTGSNGRTSTTGSTPAKTTATSTTRRFTGATVSTPYGNVQVEIVVHGTRLTDVLALHLTDSGGHSRQLSAMAEPLLRREALAAQSAHIDAVSGATYTSQGYQTSLQAAIDQAHL